MKLRRNTGAKFAITGVAAGLLLAFLGLVKADTRLHAQEQPETQPTTTTTTTRTRPDYRYFFVPGSGEREARRLPQTSPQTSPQSQPSATVHTRTRAS